MIFLVQAGMAQFGVKTGLAVSNFYYADIGPVPDLSYEIDLRPYLGYEAEMVQLGEQNPLLTPGLAIYMEFDLLHWLSLQPEISYVQKGTNFSQNEYEPIIYRVRINYIEIPLLVNFKYVNREKIISQFYTGGYASFRLTALKEVATYGTDVQKTWLDNAQAVTFGLHMGNTLKYKAGKGFILLDVRAFLDLSDALSVPGDQVPLYTEIQKVRNTGAYFMLGYEF